MRITGVLRHRSVGSRFLSLVVFRWSDGLFHFDFHAHPGMDTALKEMFSFRQVVDLGVAALQDAGFGYGEVGEAADAFRDGFFSIIETGDEAAAEVTSRRA